MKIRTKLAWIATSLFLGSAHAATPDLTGNWIAELKVFDNVDYRRFSLKQEGATLSGTAINTSITGTLDKNKVELKFIQKDGPTTDFSTTLAKEELVGTGIRFGLPVKIRAYREPPAPTQSATHVFEPKEFHRSFSGAIPPALKINPGDVVKTWTVDAGGSDKNNKRLSLGGNPETGPFYIEGALPGDTLAVHLRKLTLNRDTAISTPVVSPDALTSQYIGELPKPETYGSMWRLDRERGVASLVLPASERLKNYVVPLRPMLGCVAVAPPPGTAYRTGNLGPFGGNMDYNRITEGTTVYLPVFQVGALLFVGDAHAAQGDGELTGNALETSMDVEFSVDVIRGQALNMPTAENDDYRMAMGIAGSLNEALQYATTTMARWLTRDYKLNPQEVASLFGTAMSYDIAEVVDPQVHIVARISKKALEQIGK